MLSVMSVRLLSTGISPCSPSLQFSPRATMRYRATRASSPTCSLNLTEQFSRGPSVKYCSASSCTSSSGCPVSASYISSLTATTCTLSVLLTTLVRKSAVSPQRMKRGTLGTTINLFIVIAASASVPNCKSCVKANPRMLHLVRSSGIVKEKETRPLSSVVMLGRKKASVFKLLRSATSSFFAPVPASVFAGSTTMSISSSSATASETVGKRTSLSTATDRDILTVAVLNMTRPLVMRPLCP